MPPIKKKNGKQAPANGQPAQITKTQAASMSYKEFMELEWVRKLFEAWKEKPNLSIELAVGAHALTEDQMKEIMGWEIETEENKFGNDYLLIDEEGNRIRCNKNNKNRPFDPAWQSRLTQEFLNQRWAFNGESFIIGESGSVLSAQHRGTGFIAACQKYRQQINHWKELGPEPRMETVIIRGIDEAHETIRTLDNVRTRNLTDVLFTEDAFASITPTDRKAMCRVADYAIRLLWDRTGVAEIDSFAPIRTNSEAVDFLRRHETLKDAVKHIVEEDKDRRLRILIPPGTAAAMLYMMAASKTDLDRYRLHDPLPDETVVDFTLWKEAKAFWTNFAKNEEETRELRYALAYLGGEDGKTKATAAERISLTAKAWEIYQTSGQIPRGSLCTYISSRKDAEITGITLQYQKNEDDIRVLVEHCAFDGIDQGWTYERKGRDREQRKNDDRRRKEGKVTSVELAKRLKEEREAKNKAKREAKKEQLQADIKSGKRKVLMTRKEIEAENTRKAREADEQMAQARGNQ
jgi:hypothetical protein